MSAVHAIVGRHGSDVVSSSGGETARAFERPVATSESDRRERRPRSHYAPTPATNRDRSTRSREHSPSPLVPAGDPSPSVGGAISAARLSPADRVVVPKVGELDGLLHCTPRGPTFPAESTAATAMV